MKPNRLLDWWNRRRARWLEEQLVRLDEAIKFNKDMIRWLEKEPDLRKRRYEIFCNLLKIHSAYQEERVGLERRMRPPEKSTPPLVPYDTLGTPQGVKYTTCPKCRRSSFHPEDVRYRYCANCHEFYSCIPPQS